MGAGVDEDVVAAGEAPGGTPGGDRSEAGTSTWAANVVLRS